MHDTDRQYTWKTEGDFTERIIALLRAGRKIQAIKEFRTLTNLGLRYSKDAIDVFASCHTWGEKDRKWILCGIGAMNPSDEVDTFSPHYWPTWTFECVGGRPSVIIEGLTSEAALAISNILRSYESWLKK